MIINVLLTYIAFGALTCASPRALHPDADEHGLRGQWEIFRTTFPDVFVWPLVLWRDFLA